MRADVTKLDGAQIDALVAANQLSPERVALAAGLMHAGARASSVRFARLGGSYRERLALALAGLEREANVAFAVACAARALAAAGALRSPDARVIAAFEAAQAWSIDQSSSADWDALRDDVDEAAGELDDVLHGRPANPANACAMDAALAVSNAVTAAGTPDFPVWTSFAAKHALQCAEDYESEVAWQLDAVRALLLSH